MEKAIFYHFPLMIWTGKRMKIIWLGANPPQFGLFRFIDPLLLKTDTWYFFSALMRVAKDASPDYGVLTLMKS